MSRIWFLFPFIFICQIGNTQPNSKSYAIVWNESLIKGREAFLSKTVLHQANPKRPNIIIILADDLGQTDISLYGNKKIQTPNIDAIGKNGVVFTEGYISSPVCSPSRAGLITGRYQQRFGHELQPNNRYVKNKIEFWAFKIFPPFRPLTPIRLKGQPSDEDRMRQGLPPSEITIAEVLKMNGYQTGIIGKWHLGAADFALPCNRGFEYQYGFNEAFTLYAEPEQNGIVNSPIRGQYMDKHQWKTAEGRTGNCAITRNCCEPTNDPLYLTDQLTKEAISFMERAGAEPFFLYLAYNAPHAPLQSQKVYWEKVLNEPDPVKRNYLAMIMNLDDQVGRLQQALEASGNANNTIIFFLSDNGGAAYNGSTDNFPYRGGKLTNFEGGLKVPFLLSWPAKIPAGTTCSTPVISLDIFTTICHATNCEIPIDRPYDGFNLFEIIDSISPDRTLFWRSDGNKAIRKVDYKLIINELSGTKHLYNLSLDPREQNDWIANKDSVLKNMESDLLSWESQMMQPLWPRVVNYIYKDKKGKLKFAF